MLVLRIADSQDALACGAECDTERKGSAIRSCVGDEDAVSQCADEEVALFGECGRDSVLCGGKGREDEQAAILTGGLEFWLETHPDDAPGRNPDDGLVATEKNSKALPFHDGVKTADEYLAMSLREDGRLSIVEGDEEHETAAHIICSLGLSEAPHNGN